MKFALLSLLLAQLAIPGQPPPGGVLFRPGYEPGQAGATYALGPTAPGRADFLWAPAAPAPLSIDATTLALYHFDESGTGNADDATGTYNLNAAGTPGSGPGPWGGSRQADNGLGYFFQSSIGPILDGVLGGSVSFEWWGNRYFAHDGTGYGDFLSIGDGSNSHTSFAAFWASDYVLKVYWHISGGSTYELLDSGFTIPLGTWHHYAVTLEPTAGSTTTASIYVDGALVAMQAGLARPDPGGGTQTMVVGRGDTCCYAQSALDELRISSGTRSAAEVLASYRLSGRYGSPVTPASGAAMTFARASGAAYEITPGHLMTANAGELRVGAAGGIIEASTSNQVLLSTAIGTGSWAMPGVSLLSRQTSPMGTRTASRLQVSGGIGSIYQVFPAGPGLWTASIYTRTVSGSTPALSFSCFDPPTSCACTTTSGTCTTSSFFNECTIFTSGITDWARVTATATCPGGTTNAALALGPDAFEGVVGTQADFWCAQVEPGPYATSCIDTGGTIVTRAGDALSLPASVLGAGPASVRLVATPLWSTADVTSATLLGSDDNSLLLGPLSGDLEWSVGGGDVQGSGPLGWPAGTAQTLDAWYGPPGGVLHVSDGTHTGTAPTASAGTPTATTLYVGGDATGGAGVSVSRLAICKGRSGVCQ